MRSSEYNQLLVCMLASKSWIWMYNKKCCWCSTTFQTIFVHKIWVKMNLNQTFRITLLIKLSKCIANTIDIKELIWMCVFLSFSWCPCWRLRDKREQLCDHPKPVLLYKHVPLIQCAAGLWKLLTVCFLKRQHNVLSSCSHSCTIHMELAKYPSLSLTGCSMQSG